MNTAQYSSTLTIAFDGQDSPVVSILLRGCQHNVASALRTLSGEFESNIHVQGYVLADYAN